MFGHDPQYDEDIDQYLGDQLRVNSLDDGTIVSRAFQCKACDGAGGCDASRDCEVYDDWRPCDICRGTGEIEVE